MAAFYKTYRRQSLTDAVQRARRFGKSNATQDLTVCGGGGACAAIIVETALGFGPASFPCWKQG